MKRRGIVSLAIAGVLASAMSIAVSAPASASDASDLTYGLRNGSNSLCLQPINATQDAGAEVVQWPCNGRAEQRWVFRLAPVDCSRPLSPFCWRPTRYQIENELSRRCLDALGGATNGTRVVQWPCGSLSNQTWDTGVTLTGSPTVVTAMRSGVSGTFSHCLDVSGGQLSTVGLPMQIWGCNGTIAQKWFLSSPPPPASQVAVPDVRGGSPGAASAELSNVGLHLGTQRGVVDNTCNNIGNVLSQTPSPGTVVAPGTAVDISIGQMPLPPRSCP